MDDPCAKCPRHSGIEKEIEKACVKIEERSKLVDTQIRSIEKAIERAKSSMDQRLEGMNEFRRQLDGQAKTFASIERVNGLEKLIALNTKAIFIGIGIMIALQFIIRYMLK